VIVTRTPFRISFFGGGTDYPGWFTEHKGAVLSTTIDKYCYISCRRLPPFFEHKHRLVYSSIENVESTDQIKHPAVKGIFNWLNVKEGLEVHHDGDLPARSGLGSSSAFTVGLIKALQGFEGKLISKEQLAKDAIYVEQSVIKENVGSQDQVAAAFGGFNRIDFNRNGSFDVQPILTSPDTINSLNNHLMLFFTGLTRIASEIADSKIKNLKNREQELMKMYSMVDESISILQKGSGSIEEFGMLLDESWQYKKSLSSKVSTPEIDEIYDIAMKAGALGGKILGAGGGGFILFFAKPEVQPYIKNKLSHLIHVPFRFEDAGSRVVLYQPNGF